jgi:hypothetical protein
MSWKCNGLCEAWYADDEPHRDTRDGCMCPPCSRRPTRELLTAAKVSVGEALLLMRVDDRYEVYDDDAEAAARAIGLGITAMGTTEFTSFHETFLEAYLAKIIKSGYRAAVCEADKDQQDRFLLSNAIPKKPKLEPLFETLPKGRQLKMLTGLDCPAGTQDLFETQGFVT